MKIVVATIGRGRGDPEQSIFDAYCRRLPWSVDLRESPAGGSKAGGPGGEAAALLKGIPSEAFVIALDGTGEALTSEAFATLLARVRERGTRTVAFLIGGADGHGKAALERADMMLSLGRMTWPHLLVRAMLAEQLWRAASILAGHPYHRA
jgi:23S rRNA (pseudouridine1915-N3)-methyltransferase